MKKVAIVGLKDQDGCCYTCEMSPTGPVNIEKIENPMMVVANASVFPNSLHEVGIKLDSKYEFAILNVYLEMSNEEFHNLTHDYNPVTVFENRKMKFIREIENPFQYAYKIFEKRLKIGDEEAQQVWKNLSEFWTLFGFKKKRELKAFIRTCDLGSRYIEGETFNAVHLTVKNRDYLQDILKSRNLCIQVFDGGSRHPLYIPKNDLKKEISDLPEKLFRVYQHKTGFNYMDKFLPKYFDLDFLEKMHEEHGYPLLKIIPHLPPKALEKINADKLLFALILELYSVKKSGNAKERQEKAEGLAQEIEILKDILPRVTEESIPLLRSFCYEKIEKFLPNNVREALRNHIIVFLN